MKAVVKVGTSTLAHATGRLNIRHIEELCKVLSDLKNAGHEIILVSSGAIGMGVGKLSLPDRPADMPTKQAAASVGQCELMYTYDKLFTEYNHTVGQILITGEDVEHPERSVNLKSTLSRLLELGALPIVNENDTVSTRPVHRRSPQGPGRKADERGGKDYPRDRRAGRRQGLQSGHRRHGHQAACGPHRHRSRAGHGHRQRRGPGGAV